MPVGNVKEKWDLWHIEISKRQAVMKKLARMNKTLFTDFQKVMNKTSADYWIWDRVHPTVAGHELLAREWIRMVSKRLAFIK